MRTKYLVKVVISLFFVLITCDNNNSTGPTSQFKLNVSITPQGGGSTVPSGTSQHSLNSQVQLAAVPNDGWRFVQWSGSITSQENPTTITINSDMNIVAEFQASQYKLTITTDGNGSVNERILTKTNDYEPNTYVELTASADSDWGFVKWDGDLTGYTNPTTIVMDSDKTVSAYFGNIKITSPSIQESWSGQNEYSIVWNTTNLTGTATIDLYRNGNYVHTIAENVELSTNSFNWKPYSFKPDNKYQIKITSNSYSSMSGFFEIYDSYSEFNDAFTQGSNWYVNGGNWFFESEQLKINGPDDGNMHQAIKRLNNNRTFTDSYFFIQAKSGGGIWGIGLRNNITGKIYLLAIQHNAWALMKYSNGTWEALVDWQISQNITTNSWSYINILYSYESGVFGSSYYWYQPNGQAGDYIYPELAAIIGQEQFTDILIYHQGGNLTIFDNAKFTGYLNGAFFEPVPSGGATLSLEPITIYTPSIPNLNIHK